MKNVKSLARLERRLLLPACVLVLMAAGCSEAGQAPPENDLREDVDSAEASVEPLDGGMDAADSMATSSSDDSSRPDRECSPGYARLEPAGACTLVNWCLTDSPCDENEICVSPAEPGGSATCACKPGFMPGGDGCVLTAAKVVAGGHHACALGGDGSLWCWGSNEYGQLGRGDEAIGKQPLPPGRVGDYTDWSEVAAGESHTCAIRASQVYCWGSKLYAGLGPASEDEPLGTPTALAGDGWHDLSVGRVETCALNGPSGASRLYCWGSLSGRALITMAPTWIGTDKVFRKVSTGSGIACAIQSNGALYCWGNPNYDGQLGIDGVPVGYQGVEQPTQVGAALDWTEIAVGRQSSCGLRGSGSLWCWGSSSYLPDADPGYRPVAQPTRFGDRSDWTGLALGGGSAQSCVLSAGGELWCWGDDDYGQVGRPPPADSREVAISKMAIEGWSSAAAGTDFTCGVRDRLVYCWGSNVDGAIGSQKRFPGRADVPVQVGTGEDWGAVSAGARSTCGQRNGEMYCWGMRTETNSLAPVPERIGTSNRWTRLLSSDFGFAIGVQGTPAQSENVLRWGGPIRDVEKEPTADNRWIGWQFIAMARGAYASSWAELGRCGQQGHFVYCWGDGSETPEQLPGEWQYDGVTMGGGHSCAVSTEGALYCWGSSYGLGIDATTWQSLPVRVGTSVGWTLVSAGGNWTCGLRDGEAWCWGRDAPKRVGSDSDWTTLSAYDYRGCGIREGALYCWNDSRPPALLDDSYPPWGEVSVGPGHSCALRTDGSLWCWGDNAHGELGIGASWSAEPIHIAL